MYLFCANINLRGGIMINFIKKVLRRLLIIFLNIVLLISIIFVMSKGREFRKIQRYVSEVIDVNVLDGELLVNYDDHGGFLGDGEIFIKIKMPNNRCLDVMKTNPKWLPLPFSSNISRVVYGIESKEFSASSMIRYHDSDEVLIPPIKNGYYYFFDRHTESKNPKDDTELFNRCSYNFTLVIYDTDERMLYFIYYDT